MSPTERGLGSTMGPGLVRRALWLVVICAGCALAARTSIRGEETLGVTNREGQMPPVGAAMGPLLGWLDDATRREVMQFARETKNPMAKAVKAVSKGVKEVGHTAKKALAKASKVLAPKAKAKASFLELAANIHSEPFNTFGGLPAVRFAETDASVAAPQPAASTPAKPQLSAA